MVLHALPINSCATPIHDARIMWLLSTVSSERLEDDCFQHAAFYHIYPTVVDYNSNFFQTPSDGESVSLWHSFSRFRQSSVVSHFSKTFQIFEPLFCSYFSPLPILTHVRTFYRKSLVEIRARHQRAIVYF